MKLQLENVEITQGTEGPGMTATMNMDGKRIASIINEGNGGDYFYAVHDEERFEMVREHVKTEGTTMDTLVDKLYVEPKQI